MNYFELYQIPISFQPNKALVKEKYFALSRKYHPDFFGNETEADQSQALEISSSINKAFKVFSNLDSTIKYILELKGLIEEEEKYQLPNSFLMEMMELNEELMEAKMNEEKEEIEKCKLQIENYSKHIFTEVSHIIQQEKIDEINEDDLLKVKEYFFKNKYLNRILDSLKS